MDRPRKPLAFLSSDLSVLLLLALARVLLHTATNGQYGFHRDELATLDDARYLAWGYVAYPPLTPLLARLGLETFGPSLAGLRLFSALAQGAAMVLTGLMAKDLGGSRRAQVLAALAVAVAPASVAMGTMLMYVSFDYLWWVLVASLTIRLLRSADPRWWLGIGAAIGLGLMTKYTMAFLVAGLVGGLLFTRERRYLASPWLWAGAALSLLIFLPNLIWQMQHGFVSLEFLGDIHSRDVRIGRTDGFLIEQFVLTASPFTIPLWIAGLYRYLRSPAGAAYRLLGWMFVLTFALFFVAQSRSYYLAAAYPMLLAAGSVAWDQWLGSLSGLRSRVVQVTTWSGVAAGAALCAVLLLPIAPVNSSVWRLASEVHDNFTEQIGWPELTETVAGIYASMPAEERARTGILTGNYGEAGAINLYGPAHGLPQAISGINSYWFRGYGAPPPETVIVLGIPRESAERFLQRCEAAGEITNRHGVLNEETRDHREILVCRGPRQPWPEMWKTLRWFG